jgi:carbon-monoxide dehydrogenase large subunit
LKFAIGQSVPRIEDPRLLRGEGRYSDDVSLPRQAHARLVRSPHAHARIRGIDVSRAAAAPGVLAALTARDLAQDGIGALPADSTRKRRDGSPAFATPRPALALDRVRHVGDPVAMVVAESAAQAAGIGASTRMRSPRVGCSKAIVCACSAIIGPNPRRDP